MLPPQIWVFNWLPKLLTPSFHNATTDGL
jgi:hypothetical protein